MEPSAGGTIILRWRDWGPDRVAAVDRGHVLVGDPYERFVFTWHPDSPTYATTVEMSFEGVPEGTVVRLRETGYRHTKSGLVAMLDCAAGWGEALALCKGYVEHGVTY